MFIVYIMSIIYIQSMIVNNRLYVYLPTETFEASTLAFSSYLVVVVVVAF